MKRVFLLICLLIIVCSPLTATAQVYQSASAQRNTQYTLPYFRDPVVQYYQGPPRIAPPSYPTDIYGNVVNQNGYGNYVGYPYQQPQQLTIYDPCSYGGQCYYPQPYPQQPQQPIYPSYGKQLFLQTLSNVAVVGAQSFGQYLVNRASINQSTKSQLTLLKEQERINKESKLLDFQLQQQLLQQQILQQQAIYQQQQTITTQQSQQIQQSQQTVRPQQPPQPQAVTFDVIYVTNCSGYNAELLFNGELIQFAQGTIILDRHRKKIELPSTPGSQLVAIVHKPGGSVYVQLVERAGMGLVIP